MNSKPTPSPSHRRTSLPQKVIFVSGRDPIEVLAGDTAYARTHAHAALRAGFQPHLFCPSDRTETIETYFGVLHRVASPFRPFRYPLLPGHGRSIRDFESITADALSDAALAEYKTLTEQHDWVGVIGLSMGLVHGLLITKLRMQPFIVTLCGLLIYRGVARFYTKDASAGFAFGVNFPDLEFLTTGRTDPLAHLDSRPAVVAIEAVARAAILAEWTGARIHILHISSADELRPLAEAKARGVDITGETCPHYVMLSSDDYARFAGVIRVNPPVREKRHQEPIWAALTSGWLVPA